MADKKNNYGSLNRPKNPVSYPATPSSQPKSIKAIPSSPKQNKRPS